MDEAEASQGSDRTADLNEWDQKFITVELEMLFEIILAANYLDIKPLLYVTPAACAARAATGVSDAVT